MFRDDLRPRTAGFAFLETLVALGVLAVGAAGAAAGFTASLRSQEGAVAQRTALQGLADLGERLRAVDHGAQPAEVAHWQTAPAAATLRVVEASASPDSALPGWRVGLAWRDRLGDEPLRISLALVVPH